MAEEQAKPVSWDIRELYSVRMIMLMEKEPLSNEYRQIVLTKVQRDILNAFLITMFPAARGGNVLPNAVEFPMSTKHIMKLPEDITECKQN
jgi:hypothetical protein